MVLYGILFVRTQVIFKKYIQKTKHYFLYSMYNKVIHLPINKDNFATQRRHKQRKKYSVSNDRTKWLSKNKKDRNRKLVKHNTQIANLRNSVIIIIHK